MYFPLGGYIMRTGLLALVLLLIAILDRVAIFAQ